MQTKNMVPVTYEPYKVRISSELREKLEKLDLSRLYRSGIVKCYWGAFDSNTERWLRFQADVLKLVREAIPGAHVTYFPAEGYYAGFTKDGWHSITEDYDEYGSVIHEMVENLLKLSTT